MVLMLGIAAVVVVVVLLTFALAATAGRGDDLEVESHPLAFLSALRSASGGSFFSSRRDVGDLIAAIEGLREDGLFDDAPPQGAQPAAVKDTSSTQSRPTPP